MPAAHRIIQGGQQPVTTLTFVDSATSTGTTITIPAGAQEGDIAVLADFQVTGSGPTLVTPTNWTNIVDTANAFSLLATSYRELPSGAGGTNVTGMTVAGGEVCSKVMLVFRPDSSASAITPSAFNEETTGGNPAEQTVSASGQAVPLIVLGILAAENTTNPAFSTASPAFDDTVPSNDLRFGYKIYNSSPADHTIDMADLSAGNFLQSGYIRVI
jgi:hypothetical protein